MTQNPLAVESQERGAFVLNPDRLLASSAAKNRANRNVPPSGPERWHYGREFALHAAGLG